MRCMFCMILVPIWSPWKRAIYEAETVSLSVPPFDNTSASAPIT